MDIILIMRTLAFIVAVGLIIILAILSISKSKEGKAQISVITKEQMKEIAEIRNDLQFIRQKIEDIDKMMKDI